MRVFVVYRKSTIYGVFLEKADAESTRSKKERELELDGFVDTRVYVCNKHVYTKGEDFAPGFN